MKLSLIILILSRGLYSKYNCGGIRRYDNTDQTLEDTLMIVT
jgi:hypothetical protein